jgi:molybdenum cofactor cytidylyltransferase
MVATVKIIPYAVPQAIVEAACKMVAGDEIFAVSPYRPHRVGLVQTTLPSLKPSILDKTAELTRTRLARMDSVLTGEQRTEHGSEAVAEAIEKALPGSDMVVVFGASAVSDPGDVIPAAIEAAGGTILRVGVPVDPGNLLVLGRIGDKPVLGAPGCARSPKENSFDWVLSRLIAGIDVTSGDLAGFGVGGLMMEIPTRPQPREGRPAPARLDVHAVVLAAGRSTRMGGPNKLMALFSGVPLVRRTVERALGSKVAATIVVTGHQAERVDAALTGLAVRKVLNPAYAEGLSSSLKAGIAALPDAAAGVLVMLGDMPGVASADLDRMIEAFRQAGGRSVVRATHNGKRGNPVILPRSMFSSVVRLEGDTGARHLIEASDQDVVDVEIGEGAFLDVDTRDLLEKAGGVLQD